MTIQEMGKRAKDAARVLAAVSSGQKDRALLAIAAALRAKEADILQANAEDVQAGRQNGLTDALIDRLTLTPARIEGIATGMEQVAGLPDPVGKLDAGWTRPNGLRIFKTRVPLGVVGIIFESRPNVTVDAASLCLKAGNACILRGGKEAIRSNLAFARVMRGALKESGLPEDAIQVVEDTTRDSAAALMRLNGYLDVLIPRGGAGLIQSVVQNATVPVIETGVGNCHVFVDESANTEMAAQIIFNAKAQRPSVCNAAETLLVHKNIAVAFLPRAKALLDTKQVELRGDETVRAILGGDVQPAVEDDWATEFLDYILAVKVVDSLDEAIAHIARYGSGHSECIVTENYTNSEHFLREVDAAAVYVNASTRFTDGGEFGFGAEIGISTQKLHARGPMGLAELTTVKYQIYGSGQIR
ncbi:glutamate-5-semialdehyde dehydrogenase [Ethanoligenens harbinense]|uniref:Gamma-glutamyl phosphate reductase n=1 Tax=Ethanoligenens harbinense (strain DSM 18485 / JCM 12961 / CGMCC 1.5033 / YUAN-3) TaxID=663278 RepID=E6U646_ETHHY|nr:glutamate-5-semialdehyde dehydrogenase [Ethanoligenens harbinense]ADU25725.1 gamma-glutamyl phosphate reductase [Ethanoligenens harbinense YUAN-3]AVQ94896.1 glutamate-5-semialdehyde dehydrogenase [Ethanoligenens harbinense YUAN-3]AYF37587.1 glutamate-5-semialdehyde dehydrogenase [Ethanoligenens harbinense]AYF40307.1 glutamate-5-semialdehyde dehydrogenase [Ethanoligenens harbinense]QCN91144.1 glutamate-5-semialdehyde dehydrogenase [Ethanoligenens harbinense]